jgi:cytochrome b pre-mRNA-processing protein 3
VHDLYGQLVRHARFLIYYDKLSVPDTPEGRFEILALHVGLAIRRLSGLDEEGRQLSQELFDLMIADLDQNMRELGVGDLSVGKQVKRLASLFYARLSVLTEAFDGEQTEILKPMLETNVYGANKPSPQQLDHLEAILIKLNETLDKNAPAAIKAGQLTLPAPSVLEALN